MDELQSESLASWIREGQGEADQTLEENWLFRMRRERFRSRASGRVHGFYVMHLADAVNVVALTPDRHLVLVRQFRAGSARDSLETPGGLLEAGEQALEAGPRELLEETGYAGDAPRLLGTVWSNPSIMSSRTTTIVVPNVRRVAEAPARPVRGTRRGARPREDDPGDDPGRADRSLLSRRRPARWFWSEAEVTDPPTC